MYYTTSFVDQSMSEYIYNIKTDSIMVGWYVTISRFELILKIDIIVVYMVVVLSCCIYGRSGYMMF